jgi:hypothetical protein
MQARILGRNVIAQSAQRPSYWLDDCRNMQQTTTTTTTTTTSSSSSSPLKRPGQALFSTERPNQPGIAGGFPAG